VPMPEFTRMVDVPRLPGRKTSHVISALAQERSALAERFGLVAVEQLDAEVALEVVPGGLVRLSASLMADVVQTCVVTLEPFEATIEERFTLLYGSTDNGREIIIDGDADIVEPLEGDRLDIGEAVAQQLSLVLDPFPRSPQADSS